ncbi:hypothetical protein ABBQ38_014803 [Trebouxia sp. C0009 RCD-2024]
MAAWLQERDNKVNICNNFLAGSCEFDRNCRFSHDAEAFLAQKPKELQGQCPFSAAPRCPFGIACLFASTHSNMDENTIKVLQAHQTALAASNTEPAPSAVQNSAVKAADATVHSEVPSGPTIELADKLTNGCSADATAQVCHKAVSAQVSDVPDSVELPVAALIQAESNCMSRDVQSQLRKKTYDFARADAVLKELGVRNTWQGAANKKAKAHDRGQKRPESALGTDVSQPASKRACANAGAAAVPPAPPQTPSHAASQAFSQTSSQTPPQAPPQAAGAAADAAADAQAETILHVPETAAMPSGALPISLHLNGHIPNNSALSSLPPGHVPPFPESDTNPPAAQTPLAAAAAAALDGEPTLASNEPAAAAVHGQKPDAAALGTPPPETNGHASSGLPPSEVEPARLYDVNRDKHLRDEANDMHVDVPLQPREKKKLDFNGKLYLAPLTTVGNLPFRRVCKGLGADITCGEMALATNLLQGQASEWALLKRHPCEDVFGVQVCGGYPDALSRTAQLIEDNCHVSFVDVNMGCPIDLICDRNAGSSLLQRPRAIEQIVRSMSGVLSCPVTIKVRKGFMDNKDVAHTFLPSVHSWGGAAVTLHGRSRQQRYSRSADWGYITQCAQQTSSLPLIGNGDVFSWRDYREHVNDSSPVATTMIARGALMKPWIFQEIKEQRDIDITACQRLDILKQFCGNGLEHWGSDAKGVETTRRFLLEWLSFLYRYVPVGLLEVVPQVMQWRPPAFYGRSDLETLLASDNAADWVRISEMLLGPTPVNFSFAPKHKSNAYANSETGMAQSREADQENG